MLFCFNTGINGGVFKEVDWWCGGRRYMKEYFRRQKWLNNTNPLNVYAYMSMFREATNKYKRFSSLRHINASSSNKETISNHKRPIFKDLLMDSSPCNYRSAEKIQHLLPNSKKIYLFRDPVERVFSSYRFSSQLIQSNRKQTPQGFHNYVTNILPTFKTLDLRQAKYVNIARRALAVFPRENILFIRFEDYIRNPNRYIRNHVLPFLGLPPFKKEPLGKISNTSKNKYSMKPETKKLLREAYAPFNHELAELLGDKKWTWGY